MSKIVCLIFIVFLFVFPEDILIAQEIIDESQESQKKKQFQKHEISFRFSYGFRTAQIADGSAGLSQHINGLKQGPAFKGSYSYFAGPHLGPSLKLSRFWASNETGDLQTNTKITFIGGGISTRNSVSSNSMLNATLHLGYVAYHESNTIGGTPLDLSANTIGMEGSVMVNILSNDNVSLQLGFGYHLSSFKNAEDSQGNSYELEQPESLSRFDLDTGLKLHL